tara:strand:- start:6956 stop:7609 length:654 start_codon:yes stop_codon:yes gene_type:complete
METATGYKKTHTLNGGMPPPGRPHGSELREGSYKFEVEFCRGISDSDEPDLNKRQQNYETTKKDDMYDFDNGDFGHTSGLYVNSGPICLNIKNFKTIPDSHWEDWQNTTYEYSLLLMVYIGGKCIDERFMELEQRTCLPTEIKGGCNNFLDGNQDSSFQWEIADEQGEIVLTTELVYKKYSKRATPTQKKKVKEWKTVPDGDYTFKLPYIVMNETRL